MNSIKQASEFGIVKAGRTAPPPRVHHRRARLGLEKAQGLIFTETFYWDLNDRPRLHQALRGGQRRKYPSMVHAGVYAGGAALSQGRHGAEERDGTKVVAKMKELPTDDPLFRKGTIRADGRNIHPGTSSK